MIVLLGPTASGKTEVGIYLARSLQGEIISADAFQVYRGLDIGTGKVPASSRSEIVHHLLDIRDPRQQFTAGDFIREASLRVKEIQSRGKIPIFVGGTGFYLRSFLKGLAPIPTVPDRMRHTVRNMGARMGWDRLHCWLSVLDEQYAASIPPSDSQRIERALEVIFATGKRFSEHFSGETQRKDRMETVKIGLQIPRQILRDRISQRVHAMMENGWLKEVDTLLTSGVPPDAPAMKAIGYGPLAHVVQGIMSREEAVEKIIIETRQYAKRQTTWFRKEEETKWFDGSDLEVAKKDILTYSMMRIKERYRSM